jgi:hypothetical protein
VYGEYRTVCKREQPALAITLIHTRAPFNLVWQFLRFQLLDDEAARAKNSARWVDSCQLTSGLPPRLDGRGQVGHGIAYRPYI